MTAAIILAGGSSERIGGIGAPKQFFEVAGVPVIMYCLRTFERCADVDVIAVAAPEEWQERILKWIDHYGINKFKTFAPPGETRQHSVYNGLLALRSYNPDRVVIHDAARPLVTERDVGDCVKSSCGYDGATPALPLNETVYQSADGAAISALLNRDELYAGQTPECYDYAKYLQAHDALDKAGFGVIRGSSEIAFRAGMKIRLYKGNPRNFKITTYQDLEYFRYLRERDL